jgi:hypothetical protein
MSDPIDVTKLPDLYPLDLKDVTACTHLSEASWRRGIAAGRYPAGLKISPRRRVWTAKMIRELLESLVAEQVSA